MSVIDLGPFRRELRRREETFARDLARGQVPISLAHDRLTLEIMRDDLITGEPRFKPYQKPSPHVPGPPAFRWWVDCSTIAGQRLIPYERDPAGYERKVKEYDDFADQIRANVRKGYKVLHESSKVRQVWTVRHNLPTQQVIDRIALALPDYRRFHEPDADFLRVPVREGLMRMLDEDRIDLAVMLRLSLSLPLDIAVRDLPLADNPSWMDGIELMIGLIPVIGNMVAAYEAYSGKDLFGRELSDFERGVLGASVLLPAAARLVKGGKAMYTTNRMVSLYGADARQVSTSLALSERLSADAAGLGRLKAADDAVAAGTKVTRSAAEKLVDFLKTMGIDNSGRLLTPAVVDAKLVKAFETVVAKHPKLKVLDALAIERIAAKGANIDHVKGQLLEELLEDHVVKVLRDPHGKIALGLSHVKGTFVYVPGHLIRDVDGLLLTDGMIIRQVGDQIQVVAVFEAKSGKASARGLSAKSKSVAELSSRERAQYLADAESSLKDLHERARIKGQPPPTTTLDEIMKRMKNTEAGGQVRSDVERLDQVGIHINSREVTNDLYVGPRTTKWFGVVPKDVKGAPIKKALGEAGLKNVEIMGFDITQAELKAAAEAIIKALSP